VQEKHGQELGDQYLTYAGKQLDDSRAIADYGIGQGCTLELSSRLLGGCYYCHKQGHNPRAPPHNRFHCKNPGNTWGAAHAAGVKKSHGHHASSSASRSGGGHAAAAIAAPPRVEEVGTVTQQHHVRSSAAVILVKKTKATGRSTDDISAFMVQEKNGNWGFVAGSTDPRETAFKALQREYGEEVGGVLPRLDAGRAGAPGEPRKFICHHSNGLNTALYAGFVPKKQAKSEVRSFKPNREIRAVRLVPLRELHEMVDGRHASMTMRPCARGSTAAVLRAMGLK